MFFKVGGYLASFTVELMIFEDRCSPKTSDHRNKLYY